MIRPEFKTSTFLLPLHSFSVPPIPHPHTPHSLSSSTTTMVAASKQDVDSTQDVHNPVLRKDSPSILALGKLFPQNKTLDHTVRFLSQVRGTDKTLMVGHRFTTLATSLGNFILALYGSVERKGKGWSAFRT